MSLVNSRMIRGRCPTCSTAHAACGPPSASVPVDENWEVAAVGGPLKKYTVTLPGGRETVMKLNEDDAKRYEATPLASAPTDTETGDAEASTETTTETPSKSRTVANKARSPRNKAASGGND